MQPLGGGCVSRGGKRYHERMKTIAALVIALLLAAPPAVAQSSLEADMRDAAAAYERKDMATAARLWKVWPTRATARRPPRRGPWTGAARGCPATPPKQPHPSSLR